MISKLFTINEDVSNPMSSALWLKGILVTFILIRSMTNGSKYEKKLDVKS